MKNRIPRPFIQDVVAKTDIVPIIESRIELKKRGSTHMACCPFHNEKTPSFTVSHVKQFYYCFGCGAHGNVIGFLMEYDHLPFVDAVTQLANQLGMTIPLDATNETQAQNDILYTLLHHAQLSFEKELKNSPAAIQYLKNRGLTGKIAKEFGVGYAPNQWEFLTKSLGKNKADRESLVTAGMLIPKDDHHYDRFRDRIIFPIRDTRGRTIGFGGRTLTNELPKYLNSPETPIFHKNSTLYGLYEVCQHHRQLQRALVVEGYLDVISLAQHNIHNAVATLGTALNAKHIQLLLRYTSDIIFCFDGDNAGRKAAWKALTISLPLMRDGLHFRFLFLPQSEDPDSLVQKIGHDAFEKMMDNALPLATVFFDELAKLHPTDSIAGKAAFAKAAQEYLMSMPQGIYKNLLLDQLAKQLDMKRDALTENALHEKIITSKTPVLAHVHKKKPKHTHLNPALTAIQLLLLEPLLAKTTILAISEHTRSPEKNVLIQLIKQCQQNTYQHFGDLLEDIEEGELRAKLAKLAAKPLIIPKEGHAAEFLGALECLNAQDRSHQLDHLIQKRKQETLTFEEQQTLHTLLVNKTLA